MESYIISPVWVYLLGIVDILKPTLMIFAILLAFFSIATLADEEGMTKNVQKLFAITIVFLFLFVLLPSRDTLIAMKIAEYATYENAEIAVNSIKESVDYIIEAINRIK